MGDHLRQTRTGRWVIRRKYRRQSLHAAMGNAISHTIGTACLLAGVLNLYAIQLGASDLYLGTLTFAIWAGAPFQLLGIPLMGRYGKRWVLFMGSAVIPALLMTIQVLLPLVVHWQWMSSTVALWILLGLMIVRSIVEAVGGSAWFPMLKDNVPLRVTGKFFGNFRFIWQVSSFVSTLAIGWLLGGNPVWWTFVLVFGIGELFFVFKIYFLHRLHEKPMPPEALQSMHPLKVLRDALHDPQMRHFLMYIWMFNLAGYMCLPFKIKFLTELGYSPGFIVAATSMVAIGAILSLRFWGRLSDRYGNRSVFSFSHFGMMAVLFGWIWVDQSTISSVYVFILYTLWSTFQSANGIAQTRYMFHVVPESKPFYLVIVNISVLFTMGVAPVIGGLVLWLIVQSGGFLDSNSTMHYRILFGLSSLLAFIPHIMQRWLRQGGDSSTSEVLLMMIRPLRMSFGAFVSFKRPPR